MTSLLNCDRSYTKPLFIIQCPVAQFYAKALFLLQIFTNWGEKPGNFCQTGFMEAKLSPVVAQCLLACVFESLMAIVVTGTVPLAVAFNGGIVDVVTDYPGYFAAIFDAYHFYFGHGGFYSFGNFEPLLTTQGRVAPFYAKS